MFSVPVLQAQEKMTMTLEDAIQTGLKENAAIAISKLAVEAAEAQARETTTALLPSLRLSGSYTRMSDIPEFALDFPVENFPANGIEIFPNIVDHYSARASVQQPLFTGFRLRENRNAARYNAQAEQYGHEADRNELTYAITKAYWNLYRVKESERVLAASIDQLSEHLRNVQDFYEEGLVTRNEVLKVHVQLSNIRVRHVEVRNNIRHAKVQLNNLIGLPLMTKLELVSDPEFNIAESPDLDHYISTAVIENPEVRELDSRRHMSESALSAARSGWYPQLYLTGNYYYQRPHQRYLPLRDEFNDSWDIGITMSFDILNWGATTHRTARARAQLNQTEYALEKRRDDITVEVTQHYLEVSSAYERVDAARLAMEQAEENFRVTEELFREEMAVNADVLDADVALLQSRMTYVDSLIKLQIAKAGLKKATGI